MWNKLAFKPNETGSENGTILMDEEYDFYADFRVNIEDHK